MTAKTCRIPFKVDVNGVIEIMGSALYSRPDSALRELIQNAHDAIMRRRHSELKFQGRIDIRQVPEEGVLEFCDDGCGLNWDEAEQYLGTLGIGLTGLLKGAHPASTAPKGSHSNLIGMYGIGLFSGFMLANRIVVESRRADGDEAVRWDAQGGNDIELSETNREQSGTTIRLYLKPQFLRFAHDAELVEAVVKEYAEFLQVPIYLNGNQARINVIHANWFDPTPDAESLELELANYFHEAPLDVLPIRISHPQVTGALYVSPQRTPGFSDEAVVTATLRRMVVSRNIRGLLPRWGTFLRGILEISDCTPTANREDVVKNSVFMEVAAALESQLYAHLEQLAAADPARLQSIVTWHRYTLAGAALSETRLRTLLRANYLFPTSQGQLSFDEILKRSDANPFFAADLDKIVWYNADRRQEAWLNSLFASYPAPCVHTLRSFEESLLVALVADSDVPTELRFASPSSPGFGAEILQMTDIEDVEPRWRDFLEDLEAHVQVASFDENQPVMAFLNERYTLRKDFELLKQKGTIPAGFQRIIDRHFEDSVTAANAVVLNRRHRLVARALDQSTASPLAGVLRLLVTTTLRSAGAGVPPVAARQQQADLDWIADCLWGKE